MSRPTQYRSFWGQPFADKIAHTHNNETKSLTFRHLDYLTFA